MVLMGHKRVLPDDLYGLSIFQIEGIVWEINEQAQSEVVRLAFKNKVRFDGDWYYDPNNPHWEIRGLTKRWFSTAMDKIKGLRLMKNPEPTDFNLRDTPRGRRSAEFRRKTKKLLDDNQG